ncbi:Protein plastid movement impared 2 [Apostasia shenzhenica]|uniref:Protein plastid movement impared 2 n=1 Tax=Apostasia shenzhenica TaxID=1088818 RepID=A0A2I0AVY4_9ASPA|nr:Protein plastid movement impared 2 [Apostasia shenzhenica]
MEELSNGAEEAREGIGSVKAAVDFYRDRIHGRKREENKPNSRLQEDAQPAELMQRLNELKREVKKVRHDVFAALEAKSETEKKIEAYNLRVEELKKEIEDANEEHVLVELARIEAEKEAREIETQRAAEAEEFSKKMEEAKRRMKGMRREISTAKGLEEKLAATNADVMVLQSEMELVRAMSKSYDKEDSEDELSKAKKKLENIKEEGFRFMASMDLVRKELTQVRQEEDELRKLEKNADSTVEKLNSKILKARSRLESAIMAEERTKAIVSNLSTALEHLQTESQTAKKEEERISEERNRVTQEIEKTEMNIDSTEAKLLGAMEDLEKAKASEAAALSKLKRGIESIMKRRTTGSQQSSTICISRWEYEYLGKRAAPAQELAEKKVEAAQTWVEALKAQEKEILLKIELVEKEIKTMGNAEEEALDTQRRKDQEEGNEPMNHHAGTLPTSRKGRRSKVRKVSASPGIKASARTSSITIKKRKRVIPNLTMILRNQSGRREN